MLNGLEHQLEFVFPAFTCLFLNFIGGFVGVALELVAMLPHDFVLHFLILPDGL